MVATVRGRAVGADAAPVGTPLAILDGSSRNSDPDLALKFQHVPLRGSTASHEDFIERTQAKNFRLSIFLHARPNASPTSTRPFSSCWHIFSSENHFVKFAKKRRPKRWSLQHEGLRVAQLVVLAWSLLLPMMAAAISHTCNFQMKLEKRMIKPFWSNAAWMLSNAVVFEQMSFGLRPLRGSFRVRVSCKVQSTWTRVKFRFCSKLRQALLLCSLNCRVLDAALLTEYCGEKVASRSCHQAVTSVLVTALKHVLSDAPAQPAPLSLQLNATPSFLQAVSDYEHGIAVYTNLLQ
jgi:hypothetical protein